MLWYTKFCQNPTIFSLGYGNLTIFKMEAVRHLGFFENLQFLSCGLCRQTFCFPIQNFAEIDELCPKSEFQDGGRRHLEFQKFHHVTVTGFNI